MSNNFDDAVPFSPEMVSIPPKNKNKKTEIKQFNPLAEFFRVPGLSVSLPSGGRWIPDDELTLDSEDKVSILPMVAADELLLKAPDALMSGMALTQMLKSCVPDIADPNKICAPDLDVILLAIRAATYGNSMDIHPECPSCESANKFVCELPDILATVTAIPDDLDLRLNAHLIVSMKPHSFGDQTKLLIAAFKDARTAQFADGMEDSPEKDKVIEQTYRSVINHQITSMVNSIEFITAKGVVVDDRSMIKEFIANVSKEYTDKITKKSSEINMMGIDRDIPVKCANCDHEWETSIEFNPSTFFASGS